MFCSVAQKVELNGNTFLFACGWQCQSRIFFQHTTDCIWVT